MQFPASYPRYLPKDLLADFLNAYATAMDLVVWTRAELISGSASYDDTTCTWTVQVSRASAEPDGAPQIVTLHPRHLVMASGLFTKPLMPSLPGASTFAGRIFHASEWPQYEGLETGRRVVVVGCGNTGADIANDNAMRGARSVTMVQHSQTCVQSAALLDIVSDAWAPSKGRDLVDSDFLAQAAPERFFTEIGKGRVKMVNKVIDKELHEALQKEGLKLWWGPDEMGAISLVFTRQGEFWWDAGCAQRIVDGKIGLKSGVEIERFGGEEGETVWFTDGSQIEADDVVFATGYESLGNQAIAKMFDGGVSSGVMERLGRVGKQDTEKEFAGLYSPTGHPGLWVAATTFMTARFRAGP